MRILIVDDQEENRALLDALLRGGGYETVSAGHGEEALARLREGGIGMIVADILMPVMDGFQLCRACKSNPEWRKIPFLFYTATCTEERDEAFALALGADRFVVKPQEPERFLEIVREAARPRDRGAPTAEAAAMMGEKAYLATHEERVIRRLERKMAELAAVHLALRESEEKYRVVVENAVEAILILEKGVIRFANPGCVRLLAHPVERLLSVPFAQFIHPEDRLPDAAEGGPVAFRVVTAAGELRWVEGREVAIVWQGKPARVFFLDDVTGRRRTEEALAAGVVNLRRALVGTVHAIAAMLETRDPYTAGHQRRVAELARRIGIGVGLEAERVDGLRMAGLIHDIGKIAVPAEILSKPRELSAVELPLIRLHPQAGYDMLRGVEFPWPIDRIVLQHHERQDGSGYPGGLAGDEILPEARILAVADVVEAIGYHRPYRPGFGIDAALEEIRSGRGVLYEPAAVDACLRLFREQGFVWAH